MRTKFKDRTVSINDHGDFVYRRDKNEYTYYVSMPYNPYRFKFYNIEALFSGARIKYYIY